MNRKNKINVHGITVKNDTVVQMNRTVNQKVIHISNPNNGVSFPPCLQRVEMPLGPWQKRMALPPIT